MRDARMLLSNFNLLAMAPGGVARLRELILTLAVQGKLVPQDPGDESASVLLKKIRAEKDRRLIAAGKIRQGKPLAVIAKVEQPFQLPQGWEWVRCTDYFIELCTGPFGSVIHKEDYVFDGVPLINPSHMLSGKIVHDARVTVKPKDAERLSAYALSAGDLVLARRGELGRYALVTEREHGWLCGTGSFFIRLHNACNREYLGLLFSDSRFRQHLLGESVGTTMTNLNQRILLDALIALPPLAEQARIVARVEELMQVCDALEVKGKLEATQHAQLVSTLLGTLTDSDTPEALAESWQRIATHFDLLLDRPQAIEAFEQTMLQLAVRGLLVPQEPSDEPAIFLLQKIRAEKDRLILEGKIKRDKPLASITDEERLFELPMRWEWVRLDEISTVIVDCPHSTAKFVNKGLLCIDTNSFKNGKLLHHKLRYVDEATFTERIARLQPQPGDLVFAREGSVGESIIIPDGVLACLGQRVMLFRFSKKVSNEFVRLVISSKGFLDNLLTLHKGIGAKHVNVGDMRLAMVPLPPFAEQSRIVARIEELRRLCVDLRQRLSASQTTQAHLAEALVESVAR
jgi:type I restriction enzyme S subunit